jgi:hypothetical protein
MNTIKRTAHWTLARFQAWNSGIRGGQDKTRRLRIIERLANLKITRGGFVRHQFPRAAFN